MKEETTIANSAEFIAQCMEMSFMNLNQQLVDRCLEKDLQLSHTYNGQELSDIDTLELKQVSYNNWSLKLLRSTDLEAKLMLLSLKAKLVQDDMPANQADKKIWSEHWGARNLVETPKMMVQRMNKAMTGSISGSLNTKKTLSAPCSSKASLFQQFSQVSNTFKLDRVAVDVTAHAPVRAILVQ